MKKPAGEAGFLWCGGASLDIAPVSRVRPGGWAGQLFMLDGARIGHFL